MTMISCLGREGRGIPLRTSGLRVGRYEVAMCGLDLVRSVLVLTVVWSRAYRHKIVD